PPATYPPRYASPARLYRCQPRPPLVAWVSRHTTPTGQRRSPPPYPRTSTNATTLKLFGTLLSPEVIKVLTWLDAGLIMACRIVFRTTSLNVEVYRETARHGVLCAAAHRHRGGGAGRVCRSERAGHGCDRRSGCAVDRRRCLQGATAARCEAGGGCAAAVRAGTGPAVQPPPRPSARAGVAPAETWAGGVQPEGPRTATAGCGGRPPAAHHGPARNAGRPRG